MLTKHAIPHWVSAKLITADACAMDWSVESFHDWRQVFALLRMGRFSWEEITILPWVRYAEGDHEEQWLHRNQGRIGGHFPQ